MSKNPKRTVTIVAATALAVCAAGAAWAGWDVSGEGTATASTETAKPVTADIATVSPLFPGARAQVVVTANNPNRFAVDIPKDKVNIDPRTATVTGGSGHCVNLDITVHLPANIVIPANARNYQLRVDDLIVMGNNPDDGCQGARFVLPFTFTAVNAR
ncbi:MAG TPA: hypothetical protein VF755_12550 [Catenuloplanes sp.]